jgi:hypothetical protein
MLFQREELLKPSFSPLSHNAFLWEKGGGEGVDDLHNTIQKECATTQTLIPDPSSNAKSAPGEGRQSIYATTP